MVFVIEKEMFAVRLITGVLKAVSGIVIFAAGAGTITSSYDRHNNSHKQFGPPQHAPHFHVTIILSTNFTNLQSVMFVQFTATQC
jgi:ascorbate-specific PTS system EIIC-type component UlaA